MEGFTSEFRVSPSNINDADSLSVNMTISHVQWSNQSDGAIPSESDLIYSETISSTSYVADETVQSTSSFQGQAALSTGNHMKTPPTTAELAHQKLPAQSQIRRLRSHSSFPDGTFGETLQEEAGHDTISVQSPSWVDPERKSRTISNSPKNRRQNHASSRNSTRTSTVAQGVRTVRQDAARAELNSQDRQERQTLENLVSLRTHRMTLLSLPHVVTFYFIETTIRVPSS